MSNVLKSLKISAENADLINNGETINDHVPLELDLI